MAKIQSHRDLVVWQKAMDMVVNVYEITSRFPSSEMYRLVSQATRSAVSVPANIAEGNARGSSKEYAHFLAVAKGSLMETETYMMLAIRLRYVSEQDVRPTLGLIDEISRMITSIRSKLGQSAGRG